MKRLFRCNFVRLSIFLCSKVIRKNVNYSLPKNGKKMASSGGSLFTHQGDKKQYDSDNDNENYNNNNDNNNNINNNNNNSNL